MADYNIKPICTDIKRYLAEESDNQEKIHELEIKDETIIWIDDNIEGRPSIIPLLPNNLLAANVKGSLDDKEQVHMAQARINELETQVANLSKETEKLSQKNSELKRKLERLKRINNEQKTIIRKTECALQVTKEEMINAKTQETAFFRELIEIQESWFPHWLSVQWKKKGSPILDPMFQKKAELNKWAKPSIISVKTEMMKFTKACIDQVVTLVKPQIDSIDKLMKPYTRKICRSYTQSFQAFTLYYLQLLTSTRAFLRTNNELTEALKILLFLASAFTASQIIFRKNPDKQASKLERCNSHESVALENGYLERTGSGNYSGEFFPKVKKRKIMSNSFDAKDHNNAYTNNDSLFRMYDKETPTIKRKKRITLSRTKRDKSPQENNSEGSVKLREAGETPSFESPSDEQLLHGNLMNKEGLILDPLIETTSGGDEHNVTLTELVDMHQVEPKVVDKAVGSEEGLIQQKQTLSSLFVRNDDKSSVVSETKQIRWRFGRKKSTTSAEKTVYLEKTGSGNYSGEFFPKVKKRKIMSNSFDAKDHNNAYTNNDSLFRMYDKETPTIKRKKRITLSRTKRDKSAQENNSEGSVKLKEAGETPSFESPSDEQLLHGNLMNKEGLILDPLIKTTSGGDEHNVKLTEPVDMRQVEPKVVDKTVSLEEGLIQQKQTLSSLFVRNDDKSSVVSETKQTRWRFGRKKSITSAEKTKKKKKERDDKCCGQRVCILC